MDEICQTHGLFFFQSKCCEGGCNCSGEDTLSQSHLVCVPEKEKLQKVSL